MVKITTLGFLIILVVFVSGCFHQNSSTGKPQGPTGNYIPVKQSEPVVDNNPLLLQIRAISDYVCNSGYLPSIKNEPTLEQTNKLLKEVTIFTKLFNMPNPLLNQIKGAKRLVEKDYNRLSTDWNNLVSISCSFDVNSSATTRKIAQLSGAFAGKAAYTVTKVIGKTSAAAITSLINDTFREVNCDNLCKNMKVLIDSGMDLSAIDDQLYNLFGVIGENSAEKTLLMISYLENRIQSELIPYANILNNYGAS